MLRRFVVVVLTTVASVTCEGAVEAQDVPAAFGTAVCCVGDIDGDGAPEFAISSPYDDVLANINGGLNRQPVDRGGVWICSLAKGSVLAKTFGGSAGNRFGSAMVTLDARTTAERPRILVGEPGFAGGKGRLVVLDPATLATVSTFAREPEVRGFGSWLLAPESRGVEADAFLVISADKARSDGELTGVTLDLIQSDGAKRLGTQVLPPNDRVFPNGVIRIPDQNGDGVRDVVCGVARPLEQLETHALHVQFLSGASLEVIRTVAVPGPVADGGISLLWIGGGGDRDPARLLVGVPGGGYPGDTRGRVFSLATGAQSFEDVVPLITTKGRDLLDTEADAWERKDGRFGASMATIGDIDGDGTEDFAVGAPIGRIRDENYGWVRLLSGIDSKLISRDNWGGGRSVEGFGRSMWRFNVSWNGRACSILVATAIGDRADTGAVAFYDMGKAGRSTDMLPAAIAVVSSRWMSDTVQFQSFNR